MADRKALEKTFRQHGFSDFRWIDPKEIVVAQWVRLKCMFGCRDYGRAAACPPNTPSVAECERFFREYSEVAIFHFEKTVPKPEDRFAWTRKIDLKLLKLEKEVFFAGHERAFLLFLDNCFLDNCNICSPCSDSRVACKEPKLARPTSDALAMDVYSTVRKVGYPIQVLSDYSQTMNRYAFLLIE
jgi:predicted metal-binding protein